jgi:hypothetical protein
MGIEQYPRGFGRKVESKRLLKDLGVDGKEILKYELKTDWKWAD